MILTNRKGDASIEVTEAERAWLDEEIGRRWEALANTKNVIASPAEHMARIRDEMIERGWAGNQLNRG